MEMPVCIQDHGTPEQKTATKKRNKKEIQEKMMKNFGE